MNNFYFQAPSALTITESQPTTESTLATTESTLGTTESTTTTTTTTESTTITTPSTSSQGNCTCPAGCVVKYNSTTYSQEELNAEITQMKKELEVEKSTLSSTIRKKTSADDPRPSAKTTGYFGIIIIVFVIGGIVALDFPTLVIKLKTLAESLIKLLK
jgi:hypothetical protein